MIPKVATQSPGGSLTATGIARAEKAKAHVEELQSSCSASKKGGLDTIRAALDATIKANGLAKDVENWLNPYYQYSNRLANRDWRQHLQFESRFFILRSKPFGTLNRPSRPFPLTGGIRRGFFNTHEKPLGNHPKPARLFLSSLASFLLYGLTSDKTATPTKALVMSFSGSSPNCRASSASTFAAE
jgi:hypothetical protein